MEKKEKKSEGHQLLKTQHVLWVHYHIMDYIDVTVTGEIAVSASSVMDFSLIAEHENGWKLFLLDSQRLKTNIKDLKMML